MSKDNGWYKCERGSYPQEPKQYLVYCKEDVSDKIGIRKFKPENNSWEISIGICGGGGEPTHWRELPPEPTK